MFCEETIDKNILSDFDLIGRGRNFVRNRGYKFVIKCSDEGYWLLCINATWINQMLKERGIKPKDFRKLTYEDIARVQNSAEKKRLFMELRPTNFWQMCDTMALSFAKYKDKEAYKKNWFLKYPLFTLEDVYEHLMDADFQQEDAIRVMEFVRRGRCHTLSLSRDEFLQLYDVPDELQESFSRCKHLPEREEVVQELLEVIEKAIAVRADLETEISINQEGSQEELAQDNLQQKSSKHQDMN